MLWSVTCFSRFGLCLLYILLMIQALFKVNDFQHE